MPIKLRPEDFMHPLDILVISLHRENAEISVGDTIAVSLRQNLHVSMLKLVQAISVRGTAL